MKRITAIALVLAAFLFLIGSLLHPKEYGRGDDIKQLGTIADNYSRWQISAFVTLVALFLFVLALAGLAWVLSARRPRQAVVGGALGLCGLVGLGGALAITGFTRGILGQVYSWQATDQSTIVNALHAVEYARWGVPFFVATLGFAIGVVMLGIGLARERLVSSWSGWVLALGGVMAAIEWLPHSNVFADVAGLVLAVGALGVGVALLRNPEGDLAR